MDGTGRTMGEAKAAPAKRRRGARTQEEKSADTRRRLIAAAVKCLHARGYAAVMIEQILQEAGVSRGAMLHQFPTRIDLMLAVVKSAFESEFEYHYGHLVQVADPLERFLQLPGLVWETSSRPEGVAVLEILLASRSDPILSAAIIPLQAELAATLAERARSMREDAGLPADDEGPILRRLIIAAARGLTIDMIFTDDPATVLETAQYMRTLLERHYAADLDHLRGRSDDAAAALRSTWSRQAASITPT